MMASHHQFYGHLGEGCSLAELAYKIATVLFGDKLRIVNKKHNFWWACAGLGGVIYLHHLRGWAAGAALPEYVFHSLIKLSG